MIREFLKQFKIEPVNMELYVEALTHNSYANEKRLSKNYQRLEWMGDAVLQLQVSKYLFLKFPKLNEGLLTKYRIACVRTETFAKVSRSIGLGKLIRFGIGEINSRGFEKDSILSDVFESITAAIYLDLGENALNRWLDETLFKDFSMDEFLSSIHDYKSELQELIQIEKRSELKYTVVEQKTNKKNETEFTVNVLLDNMVYGMGIGTNKKYAEQQAAKNALSKIKKK